MSISSRLKLFLNDLLVNKPLGLLVIAIVPVSLFMSSMYMSRDKDLFAFARSWEIFNKTETLASDETASEIKETPQVSIFEEQLVPLYIDPENITIESLGLNAPVTVVGVANDGSMETPKNWNEAGWYWKSAHPGEQGNLIINGHYDDSSARPAAFWQLKNVAVGDKVSVTDKYSKTFVYQVSDVFFVSIQDPQRLDVLQSDDSKSTITLITCGGVWLPGMSTYDKRLVVKGELVFADSEIM